MALRPKENRFQRRAHRLVTGPVVEPVELFEIKSHLRVDDTSEDEVLFDAIREARQLIEDYLNIAMINQSWRLTLDHWPGGQPDTYPPTLNSVLAPGARAVELPRFQLGSITSVTTYDSDSTSTAVTVADVFDVDTYSTPGRIALQSGAVWPTAGRPTNAIDIEYVAGYGATKGAVPPLLRRAVRNVAAFLYEHRGDCGSPVSVMQGAGAASIVDQYKLRRL